MASVSRLPYNSWTQFVEAYRAGQWDGTLIPQPPPASSTNDLKPSGEASASAEIAPMKGSDDTMCDVEVAFAQNGFLPALRAPKERERLKALHRLGAVHRRLDHNFDRIAHLAKDILNSKWGLINLVDEEYGYFNHDTGLPLISSPRKVSICAHTILLNGSEPMVVLDSWKDWRFRHNPMVQGPPLKLRFYAGVPLVSDHLNIGSLCVFGDQPRQQFTQEEVEVLQGLAGIVVREMQVWRDKQEIRIRERIQKATENFAVDCLEKVPFEESIESTTLRLCQRTASLVKDTLEVEGSIILGTSSKDIGVSSFGDTFPGCGTSSGDSSYCSAPSTDDGMVSSSDDEQETCQTTLSDSGLGSSDFSQCGANESPVLKILGAAVDDASILTLSSVNRCRRRSSGFTRAEFLAEVQIKRDGEIYDEAQIPDCLRSVMPLDTRYAMAVPAFDADGKQFALFTAYSTSKTQRFLNGYELQFLRELGIIISNAILKRMTALADQSKSRFISNISHELRTPLHGILAAAELLSDAELSDAQSAILGTVQACGNSLVETVSHVLDFSKFTRSGEMERVNVDLLQLIEETVESSWVGSVARRYGSFDIGDAYFPRNYDMPDLPKNVEALIRVDLRPDAWILKCEKGGIRRILINLLSNSFKFTQEGYVRVTLKEIASACVFPGHTMLELSVTDTGKGIAPDYLENHLFKPFSQEDSGMAGAGLGLAIIRNIVESESVKGKIEVKSSTIPGASGTDIRITFMAERPPPDSPVAERKLYNAQLSSARICLLGFDVNQKRQRALLEDLLLYLQDIWKASVVDRIEESNVVIVNDDVSLFGSLCHAESVRVPLILLSTTRRLDVLAETAQSLKESGGHFRLVSKPCRPSYLFDAIHDCIDRAFANDPFARCQHDISSISSFPPPPAHPLWPGSRPQVPRPKSGPSGTVGLRVLVVEDNHVNRALLTQWLRKKRHAYDEAENGQEAVIKFEERGPNYYDVILMDISMPVLDGIGSTKAIRALEAKWRQDEPTTSSPESPSLASDGSETDFFLRSSSLGVYILVLSGLTTQDDKLRALDAGVDGYLAKPVSFKTLATIFAKL